MYLLLGIIGFFIPLIYKLHNNLKKWKNNYQTVKHSNEWKKVAISEIILSGTFLVIYADINPLFSIPIIGGMLGFWFWLLFDGIYNLKRGYSFFFTGSEDGKEDAKTDNFLQKLPLWQHIAIKVGGIIIFTLLYFI